MTNADADFAHLEELLKELPAIQAEDARLLVAREARSLREAQRRAHELERELDGYDQLVKSSLRDAKCASDAGDGEAEGYHLGVLRMNKELHYTRLASLQRAQDALRDALKTGTLSLDDPLEELALADEEYEALELRIRSFRDDYLATYERCQALEA